MGSKEENILSSLINALYIYQIYKHCVKLSNPTPTILRIRRTGSVSYRSVIYK